MKPFILCLLFSFFSLHLAVAEDTDCCPINGPLHEYRMETYGHDYDYDEEKHFYEMNQRAFKDMKETDKQIELERQKDKIREQDERIERLENNRYAPLNPGVTNSLDSNLNITPHSNNNTPSSNGVYTWKDEKGVLHVTNNIGSIPAKYLGQDEDDLTHETTQSQGASIPNNKTKPVEKTPKKTQSIKN